MIICGIRKSKLCINEDTRKQIRYKNKTENKNKGETQMSKRERQAYRRGIADTLFIISGMSIWIVMFIAYGYMKFM